MAMTDEEKKEYERSQKHRDEVHKLELQLIEQKDIIRKLQTAVVRGLVILKYAARIFALVGCWFWLGRKETYFLAGFIVVIGTFQLVIDKVRKTVNPKIALSEWDVIDPY